MYDGESILKTEIVANITCRADLWNYILGLGILNIGIKPSIRLDKNINNVLDAYDIKFDGSIDRSRGLYNNSPLYIELKKESVFDDVSHYDVEGSAVNTLFYSLDGFYKFVQNFIDWLENIDNTERPDISTIQTASQI